MNTEATPALMRHARLLNPWELLGVIIGIIVILAGGSQFFASGIVWALRGDGADFQIIGVLTYLTLWFKADPALEYGISGAGALHWATVGVLCLFVVAVLVVVIIAVRAYRKNPQNRPGLAPVSEVVKELGPKQLVKERGPGLRPSIRPADLRPEHVGFKIGSYKSTEVWLRAEDPTILIGPSRSGKGWFFVLNWILSAPGALITTSSKMDNVKLTMRARDRMGSKPCVFAPGQPDGESLGHVMRWDPVDGCVDEETLVRRIKSLIPSGAFGGSTTNGGHWDTLGQQLASHLFHAAACAGGDVDLVWEWVGSPQRALDAVRIIRDHPDGLEEHANHLETIIEMPAEQRSSQWGTLPTVLAFLESRTARTWMKPDEKTTVDLVQFVLQSQTLYLVGDEATTGGYKRLIDGLLAELDYVTKGLADASPGSRLDPFVTYLLDEAGNFEYAGLYELITAGGGRGRVGIAVFQSKSQLDQWGQHESAAIWDAAPAKIILPGGADEKDLQGVSSLIGDRFVERESQTLGSGPGSVQISSQREAVIQASEIREMAKGYCLLFYRHLKPIVPQLVPFGDNPEYPACSADEKALSKASRAQSPFAAALAAANGARRA